MTEERSPSESADRLSASVEEIERAIESAISRLEAERKAEATAAAAAADRKSLVSQRVSIAALLLTMMLSFLGFVRAGEDSSSSDDKTVVEQSKNDAASEWALYQTKQAQRTSLVEAEDAIERSVLGMRIDDPGRRLARFHHREYGEQVRAVDAENGQVFHRIQSLNRREYLARKDAEQHDRRKDRYDMGIRTLTLALVLISVTLLVDRDYLFWFGLAIAAIGAALGVTAYFLH
ncbi:MAG TPA: DUF4337 family protein [Kofleriaceae bacterium]|nr:DUF4337 family protein [Kofleriaceae bacterium]